MRRSELKDLIKEAMLEILPDLMEIMAENINENYSPPTSVRQKPDLTLVRQHAAEASRGTGRGEYELDEDMLPVKRHRAKSSAPIPNNPKEVINGEVFASGAGIMEWYQNAGGKAPPPSEFKHTEKQMNEFLSKKFGV
jgi:hypothetical protein